MSLTEKYEKMIQTHRQITRYEEIAAVLHWDQMVNMPPKGLEARSEELALLSGDIHRMTTAPDYVDLLAELDAAKGDLTDDQRANLREIKRGVDKQVKVPGDLVEEISRHRSRCHAAWEQARAKSNFAEFREPLTRMIELSTREAQAKAEDGASVYDTLLDDFEVGSTEERTTAILEDLRARLVPFIHKVLGAPHPEIPKVAGRNFPVDVQRKVGLGLIEAIGFDFEGGRQDVSTHPFCTGSRGDVRITTRFYDDDPRPSLFGMLHEAGHGLYEQNTSAEHSLTPLGRSVSLGVHESQSRLWENLVGRSLPFWNAFYGEVQQAFPEALGDVSKEGFYRFVNQIRGSLIRVEADEATYNLHIILRFEIERDLFAGKIAVGDLPGIWNQKMKDYLDVDVPNDAVGVMQDVHWSEGLFGYFPTYSLGNLYGAQLFAAAGKALGDLPGMIEAKEFAPLLGWLRENVHQQGMRYLPEDLIEHATGAKPTAEAFMSYLEAKFGPIYGV